MRKRLIRSGLRHAAVFILILFFSEAVQADLIHLRNGQIIEGYFLRQEKDYFVFRTFDGERKIRAGDISGMEMGYSGIPFCLKVKGHKEVCEGLLHGVNDSSVVYVEKPGNLEKKKYPLGDIDYITFRKQNAGQLILPMLGTGVVLETGKNESRRFGRIKEISGDRVIIADKVKGETVITETELTEGKIYQYIHPVDRNFQIERGLGPGTFIPGLYQIQRKDYITGALITGGLLFGTAAVFAEMTRANLIDDRAMTDPLFLLYDNPAYRKEFQARQLNQAVIGFITAGIYAFHLYDAGLVSMLQGRPEEPDTRKSAFYLGLNPCLTVVSFAASGGKEHYCGFVAGFRF